MLKRILACLGTETKHKEWALWVPRKREREKQETAYVYQC